MDLDIVLLKSYIDGDEGAFTELFGRHKEALYCFIYRMVGNVDDAMELTQKTFVKVFQEAEGFEGRSKFRTWLFKIAVNLSKNHRRSLARDPAFSSASKEEFLEATSVSPLQGVAEAVAEGEEAAVLRECVDALPSAQRETLMLRIYEDLTYVEIAELLGRSVGTVKANYHHAIKNLKDKN
ncbi:MAG: sigma-70 family RNA polymerase sigma factor [Deltaproteobacteria bacterium]|nr:sigma-70 family RNA polymerase sigma factor [Deltaproteobacteria bacterium]